MRSTRTFFVLFTVMVCCVQSGGKSEAISSVYLFEGARLVTGDGSAAVENSAFLVANGKFVQIGKKGELRLPPGAARVDLAGKTVIPGLIDAHAHVGYANYQNWTD